MGKNKWTCRCAEHVRVEGAVEGTREEVIDWMKSRFPGLRKTDERQVEQWYRDYKGGVKQYEIAWKDAAVSESQYLYLAEKIGEDNKEAALQVLEGLNELCERTPLVKVVKEALDLAFVDKMRSLGWTVMTDKFYEKDGERHVQYRLSDPDSAEAMQSSPLSACLGCLKYDLNHTFVTSDWHFRDWMCRGGLLAESTEEEEAQHIEQWNSVVGRDDLVLYIGDFCDGGVGDLEELSKKLNGRKVLIRGNHDCIDDEWYRCAFEDVVNELRIDELNLRLIHVKEEAKDLHPGERIIYGHEHRLMSDPPPTTSDSICVCAKWHGWKPITLAEAVRQMDVAQA